MSKVLIGIDILVQVIRLYLSPPPIDFIGFHKISKYKFQKFQLKLDKFHKFSILIRQSQISQDLLNWEISKYPVTT